MKRLMIAATLTALNVAPPTPALAKIDSLAKCYDAVITWCNDKFPDRADSCAKGGMDQCDEVFTADADNPEARPVINRLRLLVRPGVDGAPRFRWRAELDPALPSPTGNSGDSDGNDGSIPGGGSGSPGDPTGAGGGSTGRGG